MPLPHNFKKGWEDGLWHFQSLMGKWLCLLGLGNPQAQEEVHILGN